MRVAITGGTGFIGSRVVQQLVAAGHSVVCVVRKPDSEPARALQALGAETRAGDILDAPSLARAFAGCDGVIHLAASYEIGVVGKAADEALKKNLAGTTNALTAARDAGAKKVVYTSSIVVHGVTDGAIVDESFHYRSNYFPTFYAMTKHRAHYEAALPLIEQGVPLVIVQPGAVIGPRDHSTMRVIFHCLARGWPIPLGGARYGIVDVDECARGHVLALEKGTVGSCYHLVSENLSLADLARNVGAATGVHARPVVFPDFMLSLNAAFMGVVERVIPVPDFMSYDGISAMKKRVTLTVKNDKAKAELGWIPRPLAEAYREIIRAELEDAKLPLPKLLSA